MQALTIVAIEIGERERERVASSYIVSDYELFDLIWGRGKKKKKKERASLKGQKENKKKEYHNSHVKAFI